VLDSLVLVRDSSHREDTANTLSVVSRAISGDVNVSTGTPTGTPRVLDNESISSLDVVITDSKDGMIDSGTAQLLDDTSSVELEDELVGLDANRNGLVNDGSLQLVNIVGGDVVVARVDGEGLGSIMGALLVFTSIRIVSFSFDTVLGSISHGINGPATTTSEIFSDAINEVLFREGDELGAVDVVQTFKSTSGGESPARTARSLVLNGGDGTLSSPIPRSRGIINVELLDFTESLRGESTSVDSTEFLRRHISKVIQAEGNIGLFSIVREDVLIVL